MPGIQGFVGFVNLDNEVGGNATASYFLWLIEARHGAATAPLTIWLNGGHGPDSLLGLIGGMAPTTDLFEVTGGQSTDDRSSMAKVGPCKVTDGLNTILNPYSWSEIYNILFLSQLLGVGFSY